LQRIAIRPRHSWRQEDHRFLFPSGVDNLGASPRLFHAWTVPRWTTMSKAPSNRDAVMRLKSKLVNAKARGVSYEQMADALGQVGIAISAERLRKYLSEVSNGTPKKDAAPSAQGLAKQAKGDLVRLTENRRAKPMSRPTLDKPDAETTPAARASSFYVRPDRKDI
jgi:hypothetical protein